MRKVSAYAVTVLILFGLLLGCAPSQKVESDGEKTSGQEEPSVQVEQPQAEAGEAVGQEPLSDQPEPIGVEEGKVSGRDRLEPTDRGFRKWEWWFRAGTQVYNPYREVFVSRITEEPIAVFEYWVSHGAEEPDTSLPEWREEYDEQGRLVQFVTYSDEHAFEYERFTYDTAGRLVKDEKRSSVEDQGFESAEVWPEFSYTFEYFARTDGEPGIYRIATDFNGKPARLECERKLASGWEYMYDRNIGGPTILRLNFVDGRLSAVTTDYGDGDKEVLSYEYDPEQRIARTIETKLDGTSPLFTVDYEYDEQGRMVTASTWDHRTDKQGRIRTYSDHDERGNWKREVVRLDGEILAIVVRNLEYR
jgi:hypothetical protein